MFPPHEEKNLSTYSEYYNASGRIWIGRESKQQSPEDRNRGGERFSCAQARPEQSLGIVPRYLNRVFYGINVITFLGSDESEREKGSMKVRERKERNARHTWENRADTVEPEKSARDNGTLRSIGPRTGIRGSLGASRTGWLVSFGKREANRSQR